MEKVQFAGTDQETKILKEAISAGTKMSGAREAAEKKNSNDPAAEISIAAWISEAGPVVISFAKFARDIDEAQGDPVAKEVVKELAARLQERMAAAARLDQARRRVAIIQRRVEAIAQERAQYAAIYAQARAHASLLRQTALMLLGVVQRYGDVFLGYQFQAARALEIYTLADQSEHMAADRWHVHPDATRDFLEDIIDPVAYQSRLIASATELNVAGLATTYDTYDWAGRGFKEDVHFVAITDAMQLDGFRQQGTLSFTVAATDLAGTRWQAKVMAATVTLRGVTASTPTFALVVTHSGRCSELLEDGTIVTQLLEPRSAIVQVAAANTGGMGVGAVAGQSLNSRPTGIWRRSVATQWTLAIEPDVILDRNVNLAGLARIDVALTYLARSPNP